MVVAMFPFAEIAFAQENIFPRMIGKWREINTATTIVIEPDGRVFSQGGPISGQVERSIIGGGNFAFENKNYRCVYDIQPLGGGSSSSWGLRFEKMPDTCPKTGLYVKIDGDEQREAEARQKQIEEQQKHEAEEKERLKRTIYWDLYDNDPEAERAAISTMYLITEGDVVKFYYEILSKYMEDLVSKGTLKFEGRKNGQWWQGKAYVFTKYCRGKSFGYVVSGSENDDHTLVTLEGPAPVVNIETCRVHHLTWDSNNSTLNFKGKISPEHETTAKAKRGDKNNHIH